MALVAWWSLSADRVVVSLDGGEESALDPSVRSQGDSLLSLQVLQDDIWLAKEELVLQQAPNLLNVDLVEVVLVERALEAPQSLENLQDFSLRVPD